MMQYRSNLGNKVGDVYSGKATFKSDMNWTEDYESRVYQQVERREPNQTNRITSMQEHGEKIDLHQIGRLREKYTNPDRFEDNVAISSHIDYKIDATFEADTKTKSIKFSGLTNMFRKS